MNLLSIKMREYTDFLASQPGLGLLKKSKCHLKNQLIQTPPLLNYLLAKLLWNIKQKVFLDDFTPVYGIKSMTSIMLFIV